MTAMAQSPSEAYNTPRAARLLQDAAGRWLGSAHYDTELAQELVLAGYENAAQVFTTFAAEALAKASLIFKNGETRLGESVKQFERFESDALARREHARKLLNKRDDQH